MLYKIKISKTDYNTLSEVVTLIYTVIFKVVVINNQSYMYKFNFFNLLDPLIS